MKCRIIPGVLTGCLTVVAGNAGERPLDAAVVRDEAVESRGISDHVTPEIDLRGRYEFVDTDGLAEAWAATLRSRLGLLLHGPAAFSGYAEYEGTLPADRTSYRAASVHGPADRAIIADPESHELNQLWIAYEGHDTAVKLGRQRLVLDNARFVGNVGWRQNEQTFDAVTLTNTAIADLTLFYGFVDRVDRIFGSGPVRSPAQRDFTGNTHLANVAYDGLPVGKLTAYAYWMDLHNDAGDANSNQTFGISLAGAPRVESIDGLKIPYRLEYAFQEDAFDSPLDYSAHYGHARIGADYRGHALAAGYEILSAGDGVGFKTPLATLHAFNGFNDVFLETPPGGLEDLYLHASTNLPLDVKLEGWFHWFAAEDGGADYGREFDVVATKTFNDHLTMLGKFAHYDADQFGADETLVSLEFGLKF